MTGLVSAHVSCGGVDKDSCYKCAPNGVTRKKLSKLQHTADAATQPAPLLASMNSALTAARIMQTSLKESLDKTTDSAHGVSCGGHDATSCEACMGDIPEPSKCNGDCSYDGEICVLRPAAQRFALGGDPSKVPIGDADYAFVGINKQKVSCGGSDADRCELCGAGLQEGASQCNGDCYFSAGGTCMPKFETMQRHTKDAEDSLKTLLQLVDHGYSILKSDKLGNSDFHELGDRDLDMVNGMVPDIT